MHVAVERLCNMANGKSYLRKVRYVLVLALSVSFARETYLAVHRHLQGHTMTTIETETPALRTFPRVTLCPLPTEDNILGSISNYYFLNWTFWEEVEWARSVPPGDSFIVDWSQGGSLTNNDSWAMMSYDNYKNRPKTLPKVWRGIGVWQEHFGLGFDHKNMTRCFTYTSPMKQPSGMASSLYLRLNVSDVDMVVLYLHEYSRPLRASEPLYGSKSYQIVVQQDRTRGFTQYLHYKLDSYKVQMLPEKDWSCHDEHFNAGIDLMDCIEAKIQERIKCTYPWSSGTNHNQEICSTQKHLESYKHEYLQLMEYGKKRIYKHFGCTYKCSFTSYPSRAPATRIYDDLGNSEKYVFLHVSLLATEVESYKQVLSYDFSMMMGNIGGYLGLFLGASILSIYDEVAGCIGRLCA